MKFINKLAWGFACCLALGALLTGDSYAVGQDAKAVKEILQGSGKMGDAIQDLYVKPPWLFVLTQSRGLKVFELNGSTTPVKVVPLEDQAVALFYDGKGSLYVRSTTGNGFHQIDVRKPAAAAYSKLIPVRFMRDMALITSGAYIAAEEDGLEKVKSLGEGNTIEKIKGCDFATSLVIKGDYLYLGCSSVFEIMHVSESSAPTVTGFVQFDGDISNAFVDGDIAYLPMPTGFVNLVNIKNPAAPVVEKKIYAEAEYRGAMGFDEKYVYVGSRYGLTIISKQSGEAKRLEFGARVYRIQILGRDAYCLGNTAIFKISLDNIDYSKLPVVPEYVPMEGD